MIEISNVSKTYHTRHGPAHVLRDVNLTLKRGEKIAILGRNGSGKSTFIRVASRIEQPTHGTVNSSLSLSWPLAFSGAFQGSLTGEDNLRFICRIYNHDWREAMDFVQDFSQLGRYMREPLKVYSAGMRARLAFALSMVIEFDCYLLDEVFAVGDMRFQERCHEELFVKRKDRAYIIVSHDAQYLREHCDYGSVLHEGRLTHFPSIDAAQEEHMRQMRTQG
jgi:capsular polysaccharide transport system ATP-binding protein